MADNMNQLLAIKQAILSAAKRGDIDALNVTMNQIENLVIHLGDQDIEKVLEGTCDGFDQLPYPQKLLRVILDTPEPRFQTLIDNILLTAHENAGSISGAAELLGLNRTTAQERYRKIKKG